MPAAPSTSPPTSQPLLEMRGIGKAFHGVTVLHEVHLAVRPGEILGLVGENGAGKSTLMNILGGVVRPDSGTMRWAGEPYRPGASRDASRAGIAFVHQELNLFPNLTVEENLLLHRFPRRGPFIDRGATRLAARSCLARAGLDLDPATPVDRLSAGERQQVEIARALAGEPRLLILDEPTTSLSPREAQHLFELIRQLQAAGTAIIYISHALEDVLRLCHRVLILRDGRVAGEGPAAGFDVPSLIAGMVGRTLDTLFPTRRAAAQPADRLEVRDLGVPGLLRDITFNIRRGEIVGLFGLMGSGRTELARTLFGLERLGTGAIRLDGALLDGPPRRRIARGLAYLTEDRRAEGLCPDGSVAANIALAALPRWTPAPDFLVRESRLQAAIATIREQVRLQPRLRDRQSIRTLSGGNQQKAILARWLLTQPGLLILDEPTRGIDVAARHDIYQLLLDLADQGTSLLLISSELEELTGLCDRLLVMHRGTLSGSFDRAGFHREQILAAAFQEAR